QTEATTQSRGRKISWNLRVQTFEYSSRTQLASRSKRSCMISCVSTRRGKFITFEGLDGCGKSTQSEKLATALRARGLPIVVTREPGGTATGEKIRQLLLDTRTSGLAPMAELTLMFASRVQHIEEVIKPVLSSGQILLCDRFTDSSEAYQG